MTAEVKFRDLANRSATLQGFFGVSPFRWYDKQVQQNALRAGTCVRVLRVSTFTLHTHDGLNPMNGVRFQIDVLDPDSETARAAAQAIIDWLAGAKLSTTELWDSPPVTPTGVAPNFLLNHRSGMDPIVQPPVHVETLDVRVFNLED